MNDRFGLLSRKIALKHTTDDEIINDLLLLLRSRRQRRENEEFDATAEDFQFEDVARPLRAKRQWNWGLGAGMRLPMGMNIGAGIGRRKREALIAGFNVVSLTDLDERVSTIGL